MIIYFIYIWIKSWALIPQMSFIIFFLRIKLFNWISTFYLKINKFTLERNNLTGSTNILRWKFLLVMWWNHHSFLRDMHSKCITSVPVDELYVTQNLSRSQKVNVNQSLLKISFLHYTIRIINSSCTLWINSNSFKVYQDKVWKRLNYF